MCGAHADFRVRGRIFAYFLRNHGGDGITAACFKSHLGEHVEHVKQAPDRFYLPRFIGRRGWFGLRLDLGEIDWEEVRVLAGVSYDLVAPKALRSTPVPVANVVTARSLVRGAPPPELTSATGAVPGGDAAVPDPWPTAVPGAASRSSGEIRGRR